MNPIKIILVGDSTVGKTSIITQYIENRFEEEYLITMVGDKFPKDFKTKSGEIIKIEIWDTAGNEQYRAVNKIFMKNSKIVIFVYDITKENTFNNLSFWYQQVININNKDELIFAVAGNKSDLYEGQKVSAEEGENYAKKINAIFTEISAMDHECIENMFDNIVNVYYDKIKKEKKEEKSNSGKIKKNDSTESSTNSDIKNSSKDGNFVLDPVKSSSKNNKNNEWCECLKKWLPF